MNSTQVVSRSRDVSLGDIALYFFIAYLGTWLCFVPMLVNPALGDVLMAVLFIGSAFLGPALGAILISAKQNGKAGVIALLGRVKLWRVGIVWYLAALFSFFVVWFAGYGIVMNGMPIMALLTQPLVMLTVFLPFMLVIALPPAIGEEIGWRGFALPALQSHFGAVGASLILGFLHSFWHLPAFFTPILGPFEPVKFAAFIVTGMAGTFIYTWIFNNSRQSILIAILVHAAGNAASVTLGSLIAEHLPAEGLLLTLMDNGWFNALIFVLAALLLTVATRGKLSYKAA